MMKLTDESEIKKYEKQYNQLKEDMDKERSSETLKKYEILSKAYKIGKILRGHSFTYVTLSIDFDLSYTTVKRVCSLGRANKNTWNKIRQGKITAFKVAQICQTKCITYQDEIVDLVIEKNLSTYQIKDLKIKDWKDVKSEKLRLAVESGFARKSTAYYSFCVAIGRMEQLLLLRKKQLPKEKYPEILKKLRHLDRQIKRFVGGNG